MIDARNSACPGPLLEAKKGINKIDINGVVEILSNDHGSRSDLAAWAHKVGHEYLGYLEQGDYDRHFISRKK